MGDVMRCTPGEAGAHRNRELVRLLPDQESPVRMHDGRSRTVAFMP
jgi:hypothetical protein